MQILIVDLGSQYTALIGRSLRELGVRSVILPPREAERRIEANRDGLKGIIISGGAASVYDLAPEDLAPSILAANRPILGICLGMHWIAQSLDGAVRPIGERRGYGEDQIETLVPDDPLFRKVTRRKNVVWMSHGDSVVALPPNFRRTAQSASCPVAAMSSADQRVFAVQFHPEVIQTECGKEILSGFLDICGATQDWQPTDVVAKICGEIASAVPPDEKAVLAFSGGVDSSTLAAIAAPVLKNRLLCLTIDTGGLRKNEVEEIKANAAAAGCGWGMIVERQQEFLQAVAAAGTDSEAKRLAFQGEYRADLETVMAETGARVLLQGTLAPDEIESGHAGEASLIATHHNVGLPGLHPLRDLFKYEVRDLARYLMLPPAISERKPFPGPGLYCRVVGQPVTEELIETVRWADAEVHHIVRRAGIEHEFDQLVVALLCGQKVAGVKGDKRAYGYAAVVRAVQTSDFMTCRGYYFRKDVWKRIEKLLVRHPLIVGAFFDATDKPPRRTEFE